MFRSSRHTRVSTALLEVAEAMLRPVEDDFLPGDDAWQWPTHSSDASKIAAAVHPHRRSARIERMRRPGVPAAPAQHCSSPIAPRALRDARTAARPAAGRT